MEIHLRISGGIFMLLALLHLFFPKRFNWQDELAQLSLLNRQMMQVHTLFIGLTVFGMGLLNVFYARELIQTPLGKGICFGLAIFWTLRLFIQLFVYSRELWKGKKFETAIHVVFTLLWLYCASVYFICWNMP